MTTTDQPNRTDYQVDADDFVHLIFAAACVIETVPSGEMQALQDLMNAAMPQTHTDWPSAVKALCRALLIKRAGFSYEGSQS